MRRAPAGVRRAVEARLNATLAPRSIALGDWSLGWVSPIRLNAIKGEAARLAVLAGAKTGRWAITSIDPEGIDLASASDLARLWFAERVTTLKQFEKALA